MSEETTVDATSTEAAKAKKAPPEQTEVMMDDGRKVTFVGKRKLLKTTEIGEDSASVRFDFVNGNTRTLKVVLGDPLLFNFVGHGVSQKVGDETAGDKTVEDMVLHTDNILERLQKGEWGAERTASDGFSGASVVIRAIMEATGKDLAFVKGFLEKKLEAGKEGGLTRQKLYASFRAPGTKTAPIIERLERDKLAKESAINADDALAEMAA